MISFVSKLERIKLQTNFVLVAAFTVFGAIMGYVAFEGLMNRSEAVGILGIGSFDPRMSNVTENFKRTPVEPAKLLMKRIQSRAFLSAIAQTLDDPSATYAMQEAQYGGNGDMSANTIRDELALEISVKGLDDRQALARTDAVMHLIISQHQEIQQSIEAREKTIRDAYQADIDELRRQQAGIDAKLSTVQQATPDVAAFSFLLAQKKQYIDQEYSVRDRLYKSQSLTSEPYFVATKVIAGPSIRRAVFLSPVRSGILGAFAGIAFAFALIHMRKMII